MHDLTDQSKNKIDATALGCCSTARQPSMSPQAAFPAMLAAWGWTQDHRHLTSSPHLELISDRFNVA